MFVKLTLNKWIFYFILFCYILFYSILFYSILGTHLSEGPLQEPEHDEGYVVGGEYDDESDG